MGTRREIRSKYQIQGSGGIDFLISMCLPCCGLVQEYKELDNSEKTGGGAGMGMSVGAPQGYAPQQGQMTYPAGAPPVAGGVDPAYKA